MATAINIYIEQKWRLWHPSYQSIREHLKDFYDIDFSNGTLNAIHYKVRENDRDNSKAIYTIYPETEVQQCINHQIRNSMKYVASKNQKAFMADLKAAYRTATKNAAETGLNDLDAKWGRQYPMVIRSWRKKWDNLSVYFKYSKEVRKVPQFGVHLEKFVAGMLSGASRAAALESIKG